MTVVEIKRPEKTLSREDLDQIAEYVDWARTNICGSGPESPKYINGLLLVGKLSQKSEHREAMRRLQGDDIRVEPYDDLISRSREYYNTVEKVLQKIAPEYSRSKRRAQKQ